MTTLRITGGIGEYQIDAVPFAAGGTARLHRCHGQSLAYKKYKPGDEITDPAEIDRMERICHRGQQVVLQLGQRPATTPQSSVNWPIDMVRDRSGHILGVLIPLIPDRFLQPNGQPRHLGFLIHARANPPGAADRVMVLFRLTEVMAWLDGNELIHGDVSEKNIVWCTTPQPGVYLLDCDGIRPRLPPPTSGVMTPNWTDPRVIDNLVPTHDHFSDRYALALALYRGLLVTPGYLGKSSGRWRTPSAIPPGLDPRIGRLLLSSLSGVSDPDRRAPASQWRDTLMTVYFSGNRLNDAALRVLDESRPSLPPSRVQTNPPVVTPPAYPDLYKAVEAFIHRHWKVILGVTVLLLFLYAHG